MPLYRCGLPRLKSLLIPFLLFSGVAVNAQKVVEVKYEQDAKGGFVFSCYNNAFCNYILDLGFTAFVNVRSDQSFPLHMEVKPGYTKLFTVSVIDPMIATQIKFSSSSRKGCMHPVIREDFTYLLPISPGKTAQVYEMSPDKAADSAGWYVLRIKMKSGDTIYAARKGVINEVQDQDGTNDAGQSSISTENFIEITQTDCSFARYGILKKNSAFVKPGQLVNAGQAIGLVGGDSFGRGSEIRFSVYYYQEENGSAAQNRMRHFVVTQIWTKTNGKGKLKHGVFYSSEFPVAVLNQEIPVKGKKTKAVTH